MGKVLKKWVLFWIFVELRNESQMNTFKIKLIKTIELCNDELYKRKNGIDGESTEEQLENVILPELKRLLKEIEQCHMPPKEQRYLHSFANAFTVWGWNMQSPTELFILLTELNNEYKELGGGGLHNSDKM